MINRIFKYVSTNQFLAISVAFQTLLLVTFISRITFLLIFFLLLVLLIIVKYSKYLYSLNKNEYIFSFVFLLVIYSATSLKFLGDNIILYHFFVSIVSLFSALIFTRDINLYYLASKYTLIVFQFFILGYVFYEGFENYPIVVPLEKMIKDSSANGITSYSILLQVNFSLVSYLYKRKYTFLTTTLTLLIALVSYGRGSILSATLILFTNFFVYTLSRSTVKVIFITLISLLIFYLAQSFYGEQITLFLEANTKLSAGLVDDSRSRIISDYISRIDFKSLFLGADYLNSIIQSEFNGNPHNSYIRAHHIFGLPYLFVILVVPFLFILNINRPISEIIFSLLLILILIFRSFSEPIIAPTLLDFYFFSIFFILARTNQVHKIQNSKNE